MSLHSIALDAIRPKDKAFRLADSAGLYLQIQPNGSKLWRFRYQFVGTEKMLGLGSYPATSLVEARRKRDEARQQLEAGTDPSVQRKIDRLAAEAASRNTFKAVAEEHVNNLIANGASTSTVSKHRWMLEVVAAPIAHRPITEITPIELLHLLKQVEKSGRRETAKRLRATIGTVFRLAIVTLRATSDPTSALRGALLRPNVKPRAAIVDERQFGALLRALDGYEGWPTIGTAMKFLALTCVRPGEVRFACRDEFNLERATWRIPAERTKMRRPHDVPLSRQALELLRDVWPLSEGGSYVFPSLRSRDRALSEVTMNATLRRLGYGKDEATAHGFRSTASTILNERQYNPDVIEAVLGHQPLNAIRRTYNRATRWPERVTLMQDWADLLDQFRAMR